ncbi:hypothetical protein [Riemerella columbina]|uniref:hypothetical protein n=1 Tax=Riemerella columbina TaxID=103810 RepID=UPI00266F4F7C|nr:hypothetical protein [Riemerella columbina]WKS95447.1 hypothetical protein NYR17_01520 [Riemerella columbina]
MLTKIFKLGIGWALLCCLGCNSAAPTFQMKHRDWLLVGFSNFSKAEMVAQKIHLDMSPTMSKAHQYPLYIANQKFYFHIEMKDHGRIKILKLGDDAALSTTDLGTALLAQLPQFVKYEIKGQFLYLYDNQGGVIKFVAADWD